MIKEKEK